MDMIYILDVCIKIYLLIRNMHTMIGDLSRIEEYKMQDSWFKDTINHAIVCACKQIVFEIHTCSLLSTKNLLRNKKLF